MATSTSALSYVTTVTDNSASDAISALRHSWGTLSAVESLAPMIRARRWLNEAMKNEDPETDAFREITRFFLNTFQNLSIINSENKKINIHSVYSSPERAVSQLLLEDNLILPIIGLYKTSEENDDDRRKYEPLFVHEVAWDSVKQRAVRILSLAPRAVLVKFSVNIWAEYIRDMDQITEQIFRLFNPNLRTETKFGVLTVSRIDEITDNSVLLASEREDRVVKKEFDIAVETYVTYPRYMYTSTGQIEKFNTDFEILSR